MPGGQPSKAKVIPLYVGDETNDPRCGADEVTNARTLAQ